MDEIADTTVPSPPPKRKKGRKSAPENVEMRKELRRYFEMPVVAEVAARATGYDPKTVKKLYNEWKEELLVQEQKDYFIRLEESRQQTLLAISNIILDVNLQKGKIVTDLQANDKIAEMRQEDDETVYKNISYYLHNKWLETNQVLSNLINLKAQYEMAPSADQVIQKEIEDKMKQYAILQQQR